MLRAVPAFLMVLLIGNPVCCCAVAAPLAETAPSCCHEQSAQGDPLPAEEPEPVCPCARKAGIVFADKLLVPPPLLLPPQPALFPRGDWLLSPGPCLAFSHASALAKHLSGSGPPLPLHVLYGVFRC